MAIKAGREPGCQFTSMIYIGVPSSLLAQRLALFCTWNNLDLNSSIPPVVSQNIKK
ncbi:hypothetical protein SO802_026529 [Lithocarpus litseifolius]|uniref:Uncharacterized protein n=1 Tax=Lithocarpus litseifolius TaxID=425828 RepID=A0AAW2C354_9ROSI